MLSGLIPVHAGVLAVALHHLAVIVQDADGLQVVAQAHLKVVGVVGGGHLHAAGAEVHLHVLIGHDGDLPVHQGQDAGLAHQVLVPLVVGVDRHAGVAHHGLRPVVATTDSRNRQSEGSAYATGGRACPDTPPPRQTGP